MSIKSPGMSVQLFIRTHAHSLSRRGVRSGCDSRRSALLRCEVLRCECLLWHRVRGVIDRFRFGSRSAQGRLGRSATGNRAASPATAAGGIAVIVTPMSTPASRPAGPSGYHLTLTNRPGRPFAVLRAHHLICSRADLDFSCHRLLHSPFATQLWSNVLTGCDVW